MPRRYDDLIQTEEFSGDDAVYTECGYASDSDCQSEASFTDREIQERHREALLLPQISVYRLFSVPAPVNNPLVEYTPEWYVIPSVSGNEKDCHLPAWGCGKRRRKNKTKITASMDVVSADEVVAPPPMAWARVEPVPAYDLERIMRETEEDEKEAAQQPTPRRSSLLRPPAAAGGSSPVSRQPSLLRPSAGERPPSLLRPSAGERPPSLLRPSAAGGGSSPVSRQPSLLRPSAAGGERPPSLLRPSTGGRSPVSAPREEIRKPDMLCNKPMGHGPCPMAHSMKEWQPRSCRFDRSCRRNAVCLSRHSQEDKPGHLRRLCGISSSYFGRHADDFKRLYL